MTAEREFKHAVMALVACKEYPSPARVNRVLGHGVTRRLAMGEHSSIPVKWSNNLNGRECRWRREVCKEIGFTLRGKNL